MQDKLCQFEKILVDARNPIRAGIARHFNAAALQNPAAFLGVIARLEKRWSRRSARWTVCGTQANGAMNAFYKFASFKPAATWEMALQPRPCSQEDTRAVKQYKRFFEVGSCSCFFDTLSYAP